MEQGFHSKERDDLHGTVEPHAKMWRNPFPAVDVIIQVGDGGVTGSVVLVRRKNPPHGWALPGGFVEYGEPYFVAAVREAKEETGLDVMVHMLLHVYSRPDRDPRQHVVSTVYVGFADGVPVGADDAAEAKVFPLDALPPLVFDHAKIIEDYILYRTTGQRPKVDR